MNRYIKAMEIALANEKDGISYSDLINKLQIELNYNFTHSSEYTFLNWFLDNFDFQGSNDKANDGTKKDLMKLFANWILFTHHEMEFPRDSEDLSTPELYKAKFFLKGEASKQYLDYVELKDSRKSSKQSRGLAIFSIFIAVAALLINVFQNIGSPKPPYDVKIIENESSTIKLNEKIDQLENDLFKAEIMIKTYEDSAIEDSNN